MAHHPNELTDTLTRQFILGAFVNEMVLEIFHSSALHVFVLCCFLFRFKSFKEESC
jgi:hypothetical protein